MPEDTLVPRIPPHSEEAEQSVLGGIVIDPDAVPKVCERLRPDDFYNARNAAIFEAVEDLYHENREVDIITLKNQLEHRGTLEKAGGLSYLTRIAAAVPNSANLLQYLKIVKDDALYRRFISLGNEVLAQSYTTATSIDELSEHVEKEVFSILQNRGSQDFKLLKNVVQQSMKDVETLVQSGGKVGGIPTGFTDLDAVLSGLHDSDLIVIGARPAMGKSALGLNIVQNAAVREGKSCAIFSLEMPDVQLANRMLSVQSGVDLNKFRSGQMEDQDWVSLTQAIKPLMEAKIYIDDTGGISLSEVRSKCRKLKLEAGLDLVMIDYLQLMSGSGSSAENRQQEISEISRGLKSMAKELNVPVLALSQLGRGPESRSDHRPLMSDLRESGAIEQDADVVMFIYRDEYYHPENPEARNIAEIIVAKQRNGPVDTVKLRYDGQYTRFSNLMNPAENARYQPRSDEEPF